MKTLAVVSGVIITGVFSLALQAEEPTKATPVSQLSKEDQYHLRALNAELDAIQVQINQLVDQLKGREKVTEKNDLVTRVCGAAKLQVAACDIDLTTGRITEKVSANPPQPARSSPSATK